MRGSGKFCQRGPTLTRFFCLFVFYEGRGSKNSKKKRTTIGPAAKRHLNGVSLVGRWWPKIQCWFGSFVIFQGTRASIAKNPIFCEFSGEGGGSGAPVLPSGGLCLPRLWQIKSGHNHLGDFKYNLLHLSLIFLCLTSNISQFEQSANACWCNKLVSVWFCVCTGDNPLAKAHGLSSRTDAQTIQ